MAAKGGALVALLGLGKKKPEAEEPDADEMGGGSDMDSDDYDADFAAFADAAGIPSSRRASAEAALRRFVGSCKGSTTEE